MKITFFDSGFLFEAKIVAPDHWIMSYEGQPFDQYFTKDVFDLIRDLHPIRN